MDIKQLIALHTLPIVSCNKVKKIEKMLSGCIVEFRGFHFIISVAHGIKNKDSKVAIVMHNIFGLEHIPNWYYFNPMRLKQYRTKFNATVAKYIFKFYHTFFKSINDDEIMQKIIKYVGGIDYMSSAIFLPYLPIHSLPVDSIYAGLPKLIFKEKQIKQPEINVNYHFYGLTNQRNVNGNYLCDETFVNGARFIKTKGNYHVFRINSKHKTLKGCSGAPIVDNQMNLVSIVVKRHRFFKNIIYGTNFKLTNMALHQEVNSITGEQIYE